MLAADYPFLDLMWTMVVFFLWILWFWLLFSVFADIFRRHDIGGGAKTLWIIFAILLPFLGVFVYLITQNVGMTERNLERARAQRDQFDDVRARDGRQRRGGRGDRQGQAAPRQRRDHAGRVRGDQAEGTGVERQRPRRNHGRDRTCRLCDRRLPGEPVSRRDRAGSSRPGGLEHDSPDRRGVRGEERERRGRRLRAHGARP